jgi:hypothetical protein
MSFFTIIENALGFIFNTNDVAIYNGTNEVLKGNILYGTAILSAMVNEQSEMPEHPIESGAKITDHKIIQPVEIDVRLVMPTYMYASVVRELNDLYTNSTQLRIKTKMQWYDNMVLQDKPHEEAPETVDRVVYTLHFKQVFIVEPKYIALPVSKVSNVENSSTQKLGVNVTDSKVEQGKNKSILKGGIDSIKGLF